MIDILSICCSINFDWKAISLQCKFYAKFPNFTFSSLETLVYSWLSPSSSYPSSAQAVWNDSMSIVGAIQSVLGQVSLCSGDTGDPGQMSPLVLTMRRWEGDWVGRWAPGHTREVSTRERSNRLISRMTHVRCRYEDKILNIPSNLKVK